ncbi:tyrosine-protein phosphatase [Kutzneria viridogrisea]|uniref:Tyrosine phosphatase family protein n=1 Tax=Kutzneria viridogrisea TaxID=47990 RepID=A0ABR6BJQ1_9PSEU|nr:hypothetical protein [Kutzneria viridogrisea]
MTTRHLDWPGCYNARDLGGLPTADGGRTRRGVVVRSDAPDEVPTEVMRAYGIRTVVDLRGEELPPREGLTTFQFRLDRTEDTQFWDQYTNGLHATPIYYVPYLHRYPHLVAEVVTAIARAEGGVLVHCGSGRDRAGLISLVLLAFVGVPAAEIAEDHALSTDRLRPAWAALGHADQGPLIERLLTEQGTTARKELLHTVSAFHFGAYLREAGVDEQDLTTLRERLTQPSAVPRSPR